MFLVVLPLKLLLLLRELTSITVSLNSDDITTRLLLHGHLHLLLLLRWGSLALAITR